MIEALGPIHIGYQTGLYALLALIPFILLYLIKPKPPELRVPSLQFFIHSAYRSPMRSFLRRILQDILIVLQFFVVLFLAASVAEPFVFVHHEVTGQNTVLVIDVSGSSQVYEGKQTRFDRTRTQALEHVGTTNTIILAKETPVVVLSDVTAGEAEDYLKSLEPTASGSRVGDAVLLAGELLAGKEGQIVVISDLIQTSGMAPEVAQHIVESKGPVVNFVSVTSGTRSNVGFIDAHITETQTQVSVKNYDQKERSVELSVGSHAQQLDLDPFGIETFTFDTPSGTTELTLQGYKDDFALDNTFYLSAPTTGTIRVLYISNNRSLFLEQALRASPNVDITFAEPPIVPKEYYDVYVIDNIVASQILPGTFEDILIKIKQEGASAIVVAQKNTPSIDYKGLLPVVTHEMQDAGQTQVDEVNVITRNIDFGRVNNYFRSTLTEETTSLVSIAGNAIIALKSYGAGHVFYYGLMEQHADFHFSPFYPIFWNEVLGTLVGKTDIGLLNYEVDQTLSFEDEVTLTTPSGKRLSTRVLTLEEVGLYQLPQRTVAVNMRNERESNVNKKWDEQEAISYDLRTVVEERPFHIELYLLAAVVALVLLEVAYIKRRGDI